MIYLRDLFPHCELPLPFLEKEVKGITEDSRLVQAGFIFFAISGVKQKGSSFISEALEKGALAIVLQIGERKEKEEDLPLIQVPDVRQALSKAASLFYPQQPSRIMAVTGTSGKTSVASFVYQILSQCSYSAAMLGTIGVVSSAGSVYSPLTTLDPISLHQILSRLSEQGITHLVLEASSHGLEQHRLDHVHIQSAAFTNLSHDHLDYHGSLESYFESKMILFKVLLKERQTAIINADTDVSERVISIAQNRKLKVGTVGFKGEMIRIVSIKEKGFMTEVSFEYQDRFFHTSFSFPGIFMVNNALLAAALCIEEGIEAERIFDILPYLKGVKGRLEHVTSYHGAPILIDYAHKPDALEKVLQVLRPLTKNKLYIVFGCGGERDKEKRPLMGAIAARYADEIIVTDDNPRREDPSLIRKSIEEGILTISPSFSYEIISDRRGAIRKAILSLREGDMLLIAGKGHETGQIIGNQIFPFSEHDIIQEIVGEIAS